MILRNVILISVALVVSATTAMFARQWLASERAGMTAQAEANLPQVAMDVDKILVATRDAPAGTFLKPEDMEWLPWPEDGVVAAYIQEGELAVEDFKGAVVRIDLRAGQPFSESYVVYPGDRGFLAAVLEPGARAVSIPVNATTGISGFIFPGDRVDVLLTMKMQTENNGLKQTRYLSETILSAIRVLAVDQASQNVEGTVGLAKTATLEVTTKQAETIAIALQMGALSLSLNSLGHVGVVKAELLDDLTVGTDGIVTMGQNESASQIEATDSSYTIDLDILTARNDPRLRLGGGSKSGGGGSSVVVLRADQVEKVAF